MKQKNQTFFFLFEKHGCTQEVTECELVHEFDYLHPVIMDSTLCFDGCRFRVEEIEEHFFIKSTVRFVFVTKKYKPTSIASEIISSNEQIKNIQSGIGFDKLGLMINFEKNEP